VISVAETLPRVGRMGATVIPEFDLERKRDLSEAMGILQKRGVEANAVMLHGEPATLIIDEAEKENADLIVMGTRGLSAGKRWLLGSVSTHVMHHAPCNVLVVR
jgi:nucleotide-binding universal stress UspA family protein